MAIEKLARPSLSGQELAALRPPRIYQIGTQRNENVTLLKFLGTTLVI